MYKIRTTYNSEQASFKDVDALGSFMNNHDNARWLSSFPNNIPAFQNAVVFAMTARGIPFFYYGDEQYYSGGNDPANRESLWNNMNTQSDMYQYVTKINQARKAASIWESPFIERYVTDHFYSFSKGDMLVMTTNKWDTVDIEMPYLPYAEGTVVCNIFWADVDC
jgi:alpha-amylase